MCVYVYVLLFVPSEKVNYPFSPTPLCNTDKAGSSLSNPWEMRPLVEVERFSPRCVCEKQV